MITQLLKILRESIKAVPAMKYALAVTGILAVVALVGSFKISPTTAVVGAVLTLVLMVAMVIFARLTTTAPRHFFLPVTIMMWAFLIVTVGTAFLLFTSAFFQWPRGLRELISPQSTPPATVRQTTTEKSRGLVAAARQQRSVRDYESAWRTIERALVDSPGSQDASDEQLEIAMAWLRDMRVREPATFESTVRPLSERLHISATQAQGKPAADIHAHIGWANFLRYREGARDLRIEEEYAAAVALDPVNPFAHAMWGHWLATQRRPWSEISQHFQTALKSDRERPYVQGMCISALLWQGDSSPDTPFELLRVADEMRRGHEPLDADLRRRIFAATYATLWRNQEAELLAALPSVDNLATFRWLSENRAATNSIADSYVLARLTEAAGDLTGAAVLYRGLVGQDTVFDDRIVAALARCEPLKPVNANLR